MTKEELAYIAGFVDGEGCIYIKKPGKRNLHEIKLTVANTDKDVMDWIAVTVGCGKVRLRSRKPLKPYWKDQYDWSVTGSTAIRILSEIYPYLKCKKLQAEIAFKYYNTMQLKQRRLGISSETFVLREELRVALSDCKK